MFRVSRLERCRDGRHHSVTVGAVILRIGFWGLLIIIVV